MKRVNPYYLHVALEPFCGMADDDEEVERYREFDSNDESAFRCLIRSEIKPHLDSIEEPGKSYVRTAFQYYLSKEGPNFERVFESVLPPFDPPKNPRNLFVWIWQECFDGDYMIGDFSDYEVVADANEPTLVIKSAPGSVNES